MAAGEGGGRREAGGGRNYSSEHVESHAAITGLTACFPSWPPCTEQPLSPPPSHGAPENTEGCGDGEEP